VQQLRARVAALEAELAAAAAAATAAAESAASVQVAALQAEADQQRRAAYSPRTAAVDERLHSRVVTIEAELSAATTASAAAERTAQSQMDTLRIELDQQRRTAAAAHTSAIDSERQRSRVASLEAALSTAVTAEHSAQLQIATLRAEVEQHEHTAAALRAAATATATATPTSAATSEAQTLPAAAQQSLHDQLSALTAAAQRERAELEQHLQQHQQQLSVFQQAKAELAAKTAAVEAQAAALADRHRGLVLRALLQRQHSTSERGMLAVWRAAAAAARAAQCSASDADQHLRRRSLVRSVRAWRTACISGRQRSHSVHAGAEHAAALLLRRAVRRWHHTVSAARQHRHTERLRSAEAALAQATGRTGALERELRELEHQHAATVEAVRDEAARDLVTMVCSALTPASSASTPLLQSLADSAAAADPARALQQVVTALTAQLAANQADLQGLQQQLLALSSAASEAQRSEAAATAETAALRAHNSQLDARLAAITDSIDRNEGAHSSSRAGASTAAASTGTASATTASAEDASAVLAELQNDLQEVRLVAADSSKREQAASRAVATLRADLEHERQRYESLAAMLNSAAFRRGSAFTGAVVADSSVVQLQAVQELLQQLESLQAAADAGSVEQINEGESPCTLCLHTAHIKLVTMFHLQG
jgi:hypothetical protein